MNRKMGHMGTLTPITETVSVQEAVSKVLGDGNWAIAKAAEKQRKSGLSNGDKGLVAANVASAGIGIGAINSLRKPARNNINRSLPRSERGGVFSGMARGTASATRPLRARSNPANPAAFKSPGVRRVAGAAGRAGLRPLAAAQKFGGNRVGAAVVGGGLIAGSTFNAVSDAASAYSIAQKGKVKKRQGFTIEATVAKSIEDKRQVFGWASITEMNGEPVVDLQGDYVTIEVIEKAAHKYMTESRKGGDMHRRNGADPHHVADLIESVVVTAEKKEALGLPPESPTGWWVGFQVNDDATWDLVKDGKRPMFSIHGSGQRKETVL